MTRVGMGHRQGKRCRDEAALLLAQQFGVALQDIHPASYHFPVRPINLGLIAASEDTGEKWSYWLHPSPGGTECPMVREARALVARGDIGQVCHVQVEYLQDWLVKPVEQSGQKQAVWRTDPKLSGEGGCIGDIGTHALNLATFVTGLGLTEVLADLTAFAPGRRLDDNAAVLLRFDSGAKGMIWASQITPGTKNALRIRIAGDAGGLAWDQESPEGLEFTPTGEPTRILRRGGEGSTIPGRVPAGHPEGYLEAFATLYADAADLLGKTTSPPHAGAQDGLPNSNDGLLGMRFVAACVRSSASGGQWTTVQRG
jgi:predicted dehydrogenase